ncbi:MAG: aminopeptidase P family protein [Acetobacteraceae bacterium]|nr:aminopeptidase P family protein [Acetobacteraceae bacterium]
MDQLPPFEGTEYRDRLRRAQRLMTDRGLAALLVTTEMNFRYFSGLHTQSWVMPTRPMFLILPADRDPVAVIPTGSLVSMRQQSWVTDIRSWPAPVPEDDGVTLLRDALSEVSRPGDRIGAELGHETQIRMPLVDYLRVEKAIAPRAFVDASALMFRLRMVKSQAEIARIGAAAATVSAGFAALPGQIRSGMTEREACRSLQIDLVRRGIEKIPYMIAASGPGGYETINSNPSERRLEPGDVLIIDTGSTVDGYYCDFDRNFALGPAPDAARRAHDLVYAATEAGIAAARAGRTAGEVWRAMAARLGEDAVRGASVGRMGHGMGLALTEPPSVNPNDQTVLEPGMVITIEPGIAYEAGGVRKVMVHEENVLITADAPKLLTVRAPAAMPEILQ